MSLDIRILQSVPTISLYGRDIALKSTRAEAFLFYVFLSGEERFRRDVLATLLWEDRSLQLARDNLRQSLLRIKRLCPEISDYLDVDRAFIGCDCARITTDLDRVCSELTTQTPKVDPVLLALDLDDLFRDYFQIGTAFESWIRVFRSKIELQLSEALSQAMRNPNVREEQGLLAADALLAIDPTNEEAVRHKMQTLAVRGQQGEALRVYATLFELLEETYDVEPASETIELNGAIKLGKLIGQTLQPLPLAAQPSNQPPQIYVKQFDVAGLAMGAARMGKFFRAELLTNLSRFREWTLIDACH